MIKSTDISYQLLAASLEPLLSLLQKEPDFFEATDKSKKILTKSLSSELSTYLLQLSKADFLHQMFALFLHNALVNKLSEVLMQDACAALLKAHDQLPDNFGSLSIAQKESFTDEIPISTGIKDLLLNYNWPELESAMHNLIAASESQLHTVIIEVPRELTNEMRQKMRNKYQPNIVFFHLNPALLGGLRVLENGKMFDYSWSSKIQQWANQSFPF
jgi:hypothetical protein